VQTISRKDREYSQSLGYYIAGFVDGEGSFNVSLRKKSDYKIGWQVVLSFNISQKDNTVLEIIKNTLDCGIIKERKFDHLFSLDITSSSEIVSKVIPFFDTYNFLSLKAKENYRIFKLISHLVFKGEHRQIKGLSKILALREKLNKGKGRTRKYQANDILKTFLSKSSETIRQSSDLNSE